VVLDVSNGRAILIRVCVHQVQWSKVASDSDNHDIAMVHNVRAKLRLNQANCMVNISKDMWSIFGRVKPFWVERDPIRVDWGTLNRHPVLLSQRSSVSHSGPWWLLEKENVKLGFHPL
jgi:hypothetical protein